MIVFAFIKSTTGIIKGYFTNKTTWVFFNLLRKKPRLIVVTNGIPVIPAQVAITGIRGTILVLVELKVFAFYFPMVKAVTGTISFNGSCFMLSAANCESKEQEQTSQSGDINFNFQI